MQGHIDKTGAISPPLPSPNLPLLPLNLDINLLPSSLTYLSFHGVSAIDSVRLLAVLLLLLITNT